MASDSSSIRSSMVDFEVEDRLGSGSFGTVFRVRRKADSNIYVIKTVRIAELTYKEQTEAINEVKILSQLDSPFVVRYFDSFMDCNSLNIVMEYCNKGDLQSLIKKAKGKKGVTNLKEDVTWDLGLQVLLGLHYLHGRKILHRDLKSANVFLMKNPGQEMFQVKIGDLGVAKLLETSTAFAQTIVGTPYYLSPELCSDKPYRDKSDCWALGVLLYECCTLKHPFEARNQCALIMKIMGSSVTPPPSDKVTAGLISLILWLLEKNPDKRPTIREILNESWIRAKLAEHKLPIPPELDRMTPTYRLEDAAAVAAAATPAVTASRRTAIPSPSNPYSSSATGSPAPVPFPQPATAATAATTAVKGNRVRGPLRAQRVTSQKALNRYQVKPSRSLTAVDRETDTDAKADLRGFDGDDSEFDELRHSIKKEPEKVTMLSESKTTAFDEEDDDYEQEGFEDYEDDFEPDAADFVDDAKEDDCHDNDGGDGDDDMGGDATQMHLLENLIVEARERSVNTLGNSLFKKVYNLCSEQMSSDINDGGEGEGDEAQGRTAAGAAATFIGELEEALCRQLKGGLDVACDAVFGVKVLLALESKVKDISGLCVEAK